MPMTTEPALPLPDLPSSSQLETQLAQLRQTQKCIEQLIDLREREQRLRGEFGTNPGAINGIAIQYANRPDNEPRPPLPPIVYPASTLPTSRKPMRPPQPGTTRALIYQFFTERGGASCRRADIVVGVAALRGVSPHECEKAVSAVLKNRYDPHLEKVGPAEYAFSLEATARTQA